MIKSTKYNTRVLSSKLLIYNVQIDLKGIQLLWICENENCLMPLREKEQNERMHLLMACLESKSSVTKHHLLHLEAIWGLHDLWDNVDGLSEGVELKLLDLHIDLAFWPMKRL
ncbi:hypothetical protein SCA6_000976 [Theobroma cacao]